MFDSWGRLTTKQGAVKVLTDREKIATALHEGTISLAYGMGRSYGDVCQNPDGVLLATTGLDRFISFDEETGVLTCEAGVLLRDIQRHFAP